MIARDLSNLPCTQCGDTIDRDRPGTSFTVTTERHTSEVVQLHCPCRLEWMLANPPYIWTVNYRIGYEL